MSKNKNKNPQHTGESKQNTEEKPWHMYQMCYPALDVLVLSRPLGSVPYLLIACTTILGQMFMYSKPTKGEEERV